MQSKSDLSFSISIDSSDWALWLNSIVLQSDSYATLTKVEDRVQFLNEQGKKDWDQQRQSFQNLTIDKIIDITENFWRDPTVKQDERVQMLNGIRYIHQQRQARYEHLFWLVRIFAKIRGVETKLRAEKQAIDRLEASLNNMFPFSDTIPNIAKPIKPAFHGSKLPTITKPVVVLDQKVKDQLGDIKKEADELIQQRDQLEVHKKEEWYESFFKLEKKLYNVSQNLPGDLLSKIQNYLDELNKTFANENKNTPHVKDIAQLFGPSSLKSSLSETLSTLCANQNISDSELDRDQILFQCSRLEAEALYIRRLIKAKRTDLSLSLVTAIERTWNEIKDSSKEGETKTFDLDQKRWRVIFLPKDKEIYLKEEYVSGGSFKAAFEVTPFHNLEKNEERSKFVILQSLQGVFTEIEEHEVKYTKKDSSLKEFQSFGSKSEQSNQHQEWIEKSLKNPSSLAKKVSKSFQKNDNLEDEEDYKKEAENCLHYGKLPGIWPTSKVTTVDRRIAIIQSAAFYIVQTTIGEVVKAINLEDMCILLDNKLLAKRDQLVFIKMVRHSLTGVESLHKEDIIHRDLKPQNILCANDGTAGVSDLGNICASTVESVPGTGRRMPNVKKREIVGTPNYISPEIFLYGTGLNWTKINTAADIWSLGLILWEAFSGEPLDKHPVHLSVGRLTHMAPLGIVRVISEILSNKKMRGDIYKKLYLEPKERSSLAHLVWSCTRPDPSQRPSIKEVIRRYEAWAKYTEDKMKAGKIQTVRETFHDAVV